MTEIKKVYKQIIDYWDDLFRDIGLLTVLVEKLMDEEGYRSLPEYGNRSCFQLSSHFANSDKWRPGYITRVYIPESGDSFSSTATFLINLESNTSFDFPAVICGHFIHEDLSTIKISRDVYSSYKTRSLARQKSDWKRFRKESGWYVAVPDFKSPVEHFKGYILNLFDIVDQQHVIDNIVLPLTNRSRDLEEMLTVPEHYAFPDMLNND